MGYLIKIKFQFMKIISIYFLVFLLLLKGFYFFIIVLKVIKIISFDWELVKVFLRAAKVYLKFDLWYSYNFFGFYFINKC